MDGSEKRRIVISGVNLFEGGPLSVYHDALTELSENFSQQYEIIALVHSETLFNIPNVRIIEYPKIRRSWIRRIHFEYYALRKLSQELDAYLWISLHDTTPAVKARIQAVYCHNPSPFAKFRWRDAVYDSRYALFVLFYRHLYRINIHRNDYVIVQQAWLRESFRAMYGVKRIIVAHPESLTSNVFIKKPTDELRNNTEAFRFFFPAYPRVFKNAEVLLEAAELLEDDPIEIWLTFSGSEGRYARSLVKRFGRLSNVKFLGRLTRQQVLARYELADCLVFPSLLETWGLPISEFKSTGKPMLLADLPYAHESVGTYQNIYFFNPRNSRELSTLMQTLSRRELTFPGSREKAIAPPFAADWHDLFGLLLGDAPQGSCRRSHPDDRVL